MGVYQQPLRSPEEVANLRRAIIEEAMTWVGTPYHSQARLKGVGADCLTFIAGVLINVGIIPPSVEIPFYRQDFMKHLHSENYLNGLLDYGREIHDSEKQPGDVVLYKLKGAGVYCHTGIIIEWPKIIHCYMQGVLVVNGTHLGFGSRPRKILTVFLPQPGETPLLPTPEEPTIYPPIIQLPS